LQPTPRQRAKRIADHTAAQSPEALAARSTQDLQQIVPERRVHRIELAEEALRHSQAMLARTEAITHVGSWEWDIATDTVTWSAELFRIMQRDPAAGAPSFADQAQLYVPEDRQRFREAVDAALIQGTPFELDLRVIRTDGATLVLMVVGNVEIGTDKRVTHLFGYVQDVTERHVADRALRASEQRYRAMIDVAPVPFFVIGAQRRITYQNRACFELFGYTLADIPTLVEWYALAYPDPDYRQWIKDRWLERTELARHNGGRFVTVPEVTIRCKNGKDRTVLVGTAALGSAFAEPFLVSFYDVTDLKQAREAAEQATRVKSEFLSNMSHEIRTPLNAMLGLAQLLEGEALSAEQRHLVQGLRTAGRSLLGLVNDILDLSKLESGRLRLEVRTYAPAAVLAQVTNLLGQQARAKGLDFRLEMPAGLAPWLRGDPLRLEQVLVNLVGNAVKFTERGGVLIRVSQQEVDTRTVRLRLEVRDTGIGIGPEDLAILGTPFTQADGSITRRFGGTGLGLAISKQLVERMGGRVGVDSTLGVGSTFWFELPCERASANDTPPQEAAPAERWAGPCLSGVHCLVVDDSPLNLEVVERALRREGARTTLVADGQQALDCLRAHAQEIDAVLMDLQMPVMDGVTATRAIRQALGLTAMPVIAFSANVLGEQRHQAQEVGVSDFLAKPVDLDDLVAVLRRWTDPRPAVAPGAAGPIPVPTPSPGPAGFPDIPGIDGRRAARLLDRDWSFFLRMAHRFVADFADATRQTQQALARGEVMAAARRLHTLRGLAGNLGALELAQGAQALESALADPRVDPAPALADFDARLCALLTALAPWLDGAAPVPGADPDAPLDEGRLTALGDALAGPDLAALDRFEVEIMPANPAAWILIVDDDPVSVAIMARALKPVCRCDFALSGPQALERLAAERLPTLILLDVMMPEMDGYTLCRMLQADPRLKGIPVICVTASQDSGSETQALEAGAADFIAKPINPPVLRLRVGLQCQLREREQALRDSEARFEHLAHFDALTGLPNRLLLADRLHQAMAQARRRGQGLAVAYLDLNGFKAINDTHGHAVGDQLLVTVADHFKQALRAGDTLARLGGDEFVAADRSGRQKGAGSRRARGQVFHRTAIRRPRSGCVFAPFTPDGV
jgi:PAS domain S-box-containing protein